MTDDEKKKIEGIASNLESLATHYLQHIRLDDLKPRDLASQFQWEAKQLRAVASGQPTH